MRGAADAHWNRCSQRPKSVQVAAHDHSQLRAETQTDAHAERGAVQGGAVGGGRAGAAGMGVGGAFGGAVRGYAGRNLGGSGGGGGGWSDDGGRNDNGDGGGGGGAHSQVPKDAYEVEVPCPILELYSSGMLLLRISKSLLSGQLLVQPGPGVCVCVCARACRCKCVSS